MGDMGLIPRSAAKSEEKTGPELDYNNIRSPNFRLKSLFRLHKIWVALVRQLSNSPLFYETDMGGVA